jgi:hypothetical protein
MHTDISVSYANVKNSTEKHIHHNWLFEKCMYKALWQQIYKYLKYRLLNAHDLNNYTCHNLQVQVS